jgi:hypothetical protein
MEQWKGISIGRAAGMTEVRKEHQSESVRASISRSVQWARRFCTEEEMAGVTDVGFMAIGLIPLKECPLMVIAKWCNSRPVARA